tara:strand:+ start:619 stop:1425 length:807 start_codon:yes stop_codon:yes gene_type:complete
MPALYRYSGSAWVQVPNGTTVSRYTGSAWSNPTAIKYWDGDSWETVWNKSDPVTLTYTISTSQGWRESTSWRTDNYVRFGAFKDTASPFTFFGDNLTVLEFSGSASGTSTGGVSVSGTIDAVMADRPYVSSVKLQMTRTSGGASTFSGSTSETLKFGQLNKANGTSMSTYNAGDSVLTTNMQTIPASDLQGWSRLSSQTKQFTFGGSASALTGLITHGRTKQFWLSELSSGWVASGGSGSTSDIYTVCAGSADSSGKPTLEITFDYVE